MMAVRPDAVPCACTSPRDQHPTTLAQQLPPAIGAAHPTAAFDHEEQLSETCLMGSDLAACVQMKAVHVCLAMSAG
jgi:hypothetical protein